MAGRLEVDSLWLAPGASLGGAGTLQADAMVVGGALEPGPLRISGALTFLAGSIWNVHVVSQDAADLLTVDGPATGTVTLQIQAPQGAVPLDLPIMNAHSSSIFAGFTAQNAGTWTLGEAPPGTLLLSMPLGDSDGDRLPDAWEMAYFSSRTAATPDEDGDGDHASNEAEFAAGTLPGDGGSVLRIDSFQPTPTGGEISWSSVGGKTYRVVWSPEPGATETILADQISATPPINTLPCNLPEAQPACLKVEVLP